MTVSDLHPPPTAQTDDSWHPLDLNTLPDAPPIQPDLAGTGLVYPGKRHVFSGPPESAKTLVAYCILIHAARASHTVALLDFEMGAYDARQRLRELGATPDEISRVLYLEPDTPATQQHINTLVAYQPALVVIDAAAGAYQLQGLDDNKRGDVETLSRLYINTFWRADIATILIDHVVKNTETRGRFVIGSERKLGGADVHLGFDTIKPISRGTTGRYKIAVHKDRGGYLKRGHLADVHLDSDPDTHQIEWSITDPEPNEDAEGHKRWTGYMEKVSIHLELRHDTPSRNMVAEAIGGRKTYVLEAITTLIREGFVTEEIHGRTSLLTSTRRYRENDPDCNPETPQSSVVPVWFRSGSRNQSAVGGSLVPPPTGGTHGYHPALDHGTDYPVPVPEPQGWFDADGNLYDDTYHAEPTTDDIDWTTP